MVFALTKSDGLAAYCHSAFFSYVGRKDVIPNMHALGRLLESGEVGPLGLVFVVARWRAGGSVGNFGVGKDLRAVIQIHRLCHAPLLRLLAQLVRWASSLALAKTGKSIPARMAMTAMTTSSSINVNPETFCFFIREKPARSLPEPLPVNCESLAVACAADHSNFLTSGVNG